MQAGFIFVPRLVGSAAKSTGVDLAFCGRASNCASSQSDARRRGLGEIDEYIRQFRRTPHDGERTCHITILRLHFSENPARRGAHPGGRDDADHFNRNIIRYGTSAGWQGNNALHIPAETPPLQRHIEKSIAGVHIILSPQDLFPSQEPFPRMIFAFPAGKSGSRPPFSSEPALCPPSAVLRTRASAVLRRIQKIRTLPSGFSV